MAKSGVGYSMLITLTDWEDNTEEIYLTNVTVGNHETGYTINFKVFQGTYYADFLNSSGNNVFVCGYTFKEAMEILGGNQCHTYQI